MSKAGGKSEKQSYRMTINWHAFYNGTGLEFPGVITRKQIDKETSEGGMFLQQIASFKEREGFTDEQIVEVLKEQLEDWEGRLCDYQQQKGADNIIGMEQSKMLKEVFPNRDPNMMVTLWFMNIACLLHLKAIPNDEKFGWLIVDDKGTGALDEIDKRMDNPVARAFAVAQAREDLRRRARERRAAAARAAGRR